jgi:hypothetical protein
VSRLVGSLGTGQLGWASRFRGQQPVSSGTVEAEEWIAPVEENGFTLCDFRRVGMTASFDRWRPEQGVAAIDSLEPFAVREFARPRA